MVWQKSIIVDKSQGDAFWQPGRKGGFVTIKISPWNVIDSKQTVFIDELAPGDEVKEHYHAHETEIFICLSGQGEFYIDGKKHDFLPETVAYIAAGTKHSFINTGHEPLRIAVIISPGGLEERLKLMGKPKQENEEGPETFVAELANKNSHGVVRD